MNEPIIPSDPDAPTGAAAAWVFVPFLIAAGAGIGWTVYEIFFK